MIKEIEMNDDSLSDTQKNKYCPKCDKEHDWKFDCTFSDTQKNTFYCVFCDIDNETPDCPICKAKGYEVRPRNVCGHYK